MTVQQMTATVLKVTGFESTTASTVTIMQSWSITYEGDVSGLLEDCQRRYRTCEL
eukprot:CAMPEP_0118834788 /NCGR_PEP_ID=MMETSP1162-20130426/51344_1 /TAXON_ID=33656 /ORGANISM="Phaeocystis Sp, Strain CCMP2710" /LENGTH=54 /DNA_ID=CAMNT_0006766523 /DNA_START=9 /DNA_END=170 /DNA_ORIENTATION=+